MTPIKKILLPVLAAGWLFAFQSLILSAGPDLNLISDEVLHQEQDTSNRSSNALFQASPMLPGAFVEAGQNNGPEIEPDPRTAPANFTKTVLLTTGSRYLRISERSTSFHPALKLIFPFHTYL